ncbi:MAG: hypothetical protein O3A95_00645 [Planctomycetota bacterium]|nr:hypothetical protein [Planctomycetota bacterium]MDA1112799.1 hypothetical protein [Planctomycetota bacterium]
MANSRPTLLLLALFLNVSCGLFSSELTLPSPEAVRAARVESETDWELLEGAYALYKRDPEESLRGVRALQLENPDSVRLAIFLQDLELELEGRKLVGLRAEAALEKQETGLNALLLARVEEDSIRRLQLLNNALRLDPSLTQAKVHWLAMNAVAGDADVLEEITALLWEHPASAEGWRLLGELAPLFERPDLARAAAQTEPWSVFEATTRAEYTLAVTDLSAGDAETALLKARALADDLWQGRLLEAAALAQLGRAKEALEVVESVIQERPEEPAAWFNKGLLLRDYLARSAEARVAFEKFLEVNQASGESNLKQVMQVEFWLSQNAAQ